MSERTPSGPANPDFIQPPPVIRYVVMMSSVLGHPVYVARDEADATRWLDEKAASVPADNEIERQNSLTLIVRSPRSISTSFRVIAVPAWA